MTYPHYNLGSVLKWLACAAAIGGLLWYAGFQAWPLISGPSLTLRDAEVLHENRVTMIEGTARNVTAITLNDRPIFTDDDGNFKEELVLENGYTILTLRAEDRYGRTAMLEQAFVYASAYASFEHD